jgi:sporulation protein YlmC with PRC-barrel domain
MMTDSTNRVEQQIESTAERQAQLRRLALKIENGLPVYDLNGERVGDVKEYSAVAGYLQVNAGFPGQRALYLPFRLIADIRAQEIHLLEPRDTLAAQYSKPPAILKVVENCAASADSTSQRPGAREVQRMQNGYDGSLTEISAVELSSITERLSVGLTVYDVDGVRLGEISECDANRGLVVIESGLFAPTSEAVPFSAISSVNRDTQSVRLTVQRAVLHRLRNVWESEQ